jgi:hypothetical protein
MSDVGWEQVSAMFAASGITLVEERLVKESVS